MAYPNTSVLNIIIPQTSASIQGGQAPFVERIISGSRLVLQTTIDGTLTGSSDLNVNSITASNISASGYISASNLYVTTNITDAGTLTVVGTSTLAGLTGTTATFSGLVSASAGLTASAIQDAGTLTVVGTSTLAGLTGTTATFSGLVSASAGLTASAIQDAGTLTVVGNSILSTVFATNVTASNISASGNISASTLRVETSIVDGGTLTVLGNTVLGDAITDTTRITGSASISGSLSVVGNSTLQSTFVTNLTASNISASGFISGSDGVFAGDVAVNGGDITTTVTGTATLFNTNATSVTIGGAATGQVLLGNSAGTVKSAGDFIAGTNIIKDGAGGLSVTVTSTLTTIAGDLRVDGQDIQANGGNVNLTLGTNELTVPVELVVSKTTNATSYTDTVAALQVDGGARISKDTWISGSLNVAGDLTIFGSSSVVYISSSTVIINDNIIQLNAFFPFERYAGIEVFDSGSNQRSASLLWDGNNDNWTTVDQVNSASNIIIGPTASFGNAIPNLTVNRLPKAYEGNAISDSLINDDATTLRYTGNVISASSITASYGTVTNVSGTLITYVTGSFTALTVVTGSSPGVGSQVPTSPTSAGMPGQIEVDNNFIYVYTNNIWKRVPLSTWSL